MIRVTIWEDARGKFRWHAVAGNYLIVAESGQGYVTRSNARRAWRRFAGTIMVGLWDEDDR